MSSFVMVINDVTGPQLERLLAVQTRSENKVRFIPQGKQQNPGITSPALAETIVPNQQPIQVRYNWVRIEWNGEASHLAKEVFEIFHEDKRN
jgi:hypothetical protein